MSRHQNNLRRKLRAALRGMLAAAAAAPTRPKHHPALNNFFARIGDGHVRVACLKRPETAEVQRQHALRQAEKAEATRRNVEASVKRDAERREREYTSAASGTLQMEPRPVLASNRTYMRAALIGLMSGLAPRS